MTSLGETVCICGEWRWVAEQYGSADADRIGLDIYRKVLKIQPVDFSASPFVSES
jgi:hypothetical protein